MITAMTTLTTMATFTTSIAAIPTGRRRISSPAPAAGSAARDDLRRRHAALLGRDPGAGVFAGAGPVLAGIAATFVMGLGTAITVATIAVIAVSAKGLARRLSAGREGGGALIMRGIEFGAAGLVLLFGLGLLFGYLAAERATCL